MEMTTCIIVLLAIMPFQILFYLTLNCVKRRAKKYEKIASKMTSTIMSKMFTSKTDASSSNYATTNTTNLINNILDIVKITMSDLRNHAPLRKVTQSDPLGGHTK